MPQNTNPDTVRLEGVREGRKVLRQLHVARSLGTLLRNDGAKNDFAWMLDRHQSTPFRTQNVFHVIEENTLGPEVCRRVRRGKNV